jgi:2-C-methyl-D-erythritol 2,4-cyclodiphosphate synthase
MEPGLRYSNEMADPAAQLAYRIGHGYDLHRLEPTPPQGNGRVLVLGGVRFANHPTGPISHSDGDAVYHAVTDAVLGALGLPDIGQMFPDSDPRHEGADSAVFLREAAGTMAACGFALNNLDVTVICESPKIGPHKQQMIANLARTLECNTSQINLKGKTHEKVDAVGEGRAVEVHAVALLARPAHGAQSSRQPQRG